jgi:hypothetical protein
MWIKYNYISIEYESPSTNTSFFSSVVERGIAAMQVILRSLFRSREGAVLLLFARYAASSRLLIKLPFKRHPFGHLV